MDRERFREEPPIGRPGTKRLVVGLRVFPKTLSKWNGARQRDEAIRAILIHEIFFV